MINCWELVEVGETAFPVLLCNHVTLGAGFPFATQLMFSGSPILSVRGTSSSLGSTMTGATVKKKKNQQRQQQLYVYSTLNYIYIDRQTDRRTDRQTDRQIDT